MTIQPRNLVAVPDTTCVMDEAALKQLSIMFDRIAMPPLAFMNANTYETEETKKMRAWLVATGILLELNFDSVSKGVSKEDRKTHELLKEDSNVFLNAYGTSVDEMLAARGDPEKMTEIKQRGAQVTPESMFSSIDPDKLVEAMQRMISEVTRISTIGLRRVDKLDAYAVIAAEHSSLEHEDNRSTRHDVLKFAFGFPVPDEYVPWQQILEFRNDPESKNEFAMLKNCVSDIARGSLSPAHGDSNLNLINETLGYLLNRYRHQMDLHGLAIESKRMEVFVVTTSAIAAQFEGSSWRSVGQSVFAIEPRKLALLEGESTTAGSEVAYVIESRSVFSAT